MTEYMGIREAKAITGLSEAWWRMKIFKREIPFHKVGRRVLLNKDDILAMMERGRVEPKHGVECFEREDHR
jgi:excisionase family DNA binding protein